MNFALLMLILLLVTGAIWLLDHLVLGRRRDKGAKEPWWVEYPKSFFPIILIVFLLRSFLVEPFKIPSGSMIPSLLVGDFILVNKYTYGVRLPVINKKIIAVNDPKRGDVMVFRFPEDPSTDYIKRVIGLPGDKVEYRDKRLYINDTLQTLTPAGPYYVSSDSGLGTTVADSFVEKMGDTEHRVILQSERAPVSLPSVHQFPLKENCSYNEAGFTCTVPAGHFFMMGDNRDGSSDSRYWGFVPESNIVGKAFLIWWNFGDFKRVGSKII